MEFSLVALATLLLLLPGVGFITGVNFADKNVREVVFRNTPAEFGYVIFVSLVVHLLFMVLSLIIQSTIPTNRWLFDVAGIVTAYREGTKTSGLWPTEVFIAFALSYFLVASVAGFGPGYWLGRAIPRRSWTILVKHRWMLALAGLRQKRYVYARAHLVSDFPPVGTEGHSATTIEGFLPDCYFDSTGALLYLVFGQFTETRIFTKDGEETGIEIRQSNPDEPHERLVIEGRQVAMAHYRPIVGIDTSSPLSLGKLRRRASLAERSVASEGEE